MSKNCISSYTPEGLAALMKELEPLLTQELSREALC